MELEFIKINFSVNNCDFSINIFEKTRAYVT